jgi:hypothetical protein
LKLDAGFVGTRLKKYQTKISWRETTNYAAAIQDNNPKYFDDRQEPGIILHGTATLAYAIRELVNKELPLVFFLKDLFFFTKTNFFFYSTRENSYFYDYA